MHKLYELKEMLCEELKEYGGKGKLDVSGLEIVDKLAHAIKNIEKIIESYEDEEYSSYDGGGYARGGSYDRGGSYARGRSNARRDSMGRYSNRRGGYSRDADMVQELRDLMYESNDDQTRQEFQKLISKLEMM